MVNGENGILMCTVFFIYDQVQCQAKYKNTPASKGRGIIYRKYNVDSVYYIALI